MIFERFYNEELAQASFLIGCGMTGEAVVVDPNRFIEQYLELAEAKGLRIVAVTETHIHADYLSGARELARAAGATLYLSDEGTADWKYAYAAEDKAVLLKDGDQLRVGGVRLDVLKTPGHTPEHISFLLTDEPASPKPLALLSGDFVFVGDVGRPDLLETAAGVQGTMEPAARTLFESVTKVLGFPDSLLIWPGHGSGSACGKSLGGSPVTTLGYERAANWAFRPQTSDAFVGEVLSGQPEPPKYFAMMKRLNKQGPPIRRTRELERLGREQVEEVARTGVILDVRPSEEVGKGHPQGSLHIPLYRSFVTWAGWLISYDQPIIILAESEEEARRAAKLLTLIGLDHVVGWIDLGAFDSSRLQTWQELSPKEALSMDGLTLVDIRGQAEWQDGHLNRSLHIPLGYLADRASYLPKDEPVAVHCYSGSRSPVAASLLQRMGFSEVFDIPEGLEGMEKVAANHPPVEVG